MYAVQEGIRLAKSDPGAKGYLITLMDQIETVSIPEISYHFSRSSSADEIKSEG